MAKNETGLEQITNCPQRKKSGGYKSAKMSQMQRHHGLTNKLKEY